MTRTYIDFRKHIFVEVFQALIGFTILWDKQMTKMLSPDKILWKQNITKGLSVHLSHPSRSSIAHANKQKQQLVFDMPGSLKGIPEYELITQACPAIVTPKNASKSPNGPSRN